MLQLIFNQSEQNQSMYMHKAYRLSKILTQFLAKRLKNQQYSLMLNRRKVRTSKHIESRIKLFYRLEDMKKHNPKLSLIHNEPFTWLEQARYRCKQGHEAALKNRKNRNNRIRSWLRRNGQRV